MERFNPMINNSVILGFLLATIIATAFHFWKGKNLSSIILYVVLSYIGFIGGHVFASFLYVTFDLIGALHVFFGSIGSIIAILLGHWLNQKDKNGVGT